MCVTTTTNVLIANDFTLSKIFVFLILAHTY